MRQSQLVLTLVSCLALIRPSFGLSDRGFKKINSIEFVGNTAFDQSTLQNEFKSIAIGAVLAPGKIEADIDLHLKPFLRKYGFVQCEVTHELLPLNGDNVRLRIHIQEGPQYRLAELEFYGMTFFSGEKIRSEINLRAGDIVNFSEIKNGLERIKRLYSQMGFMNWAYLPEQSFDDVNKTMSLKFTIEEGTRYRIGIVTFIGCRDQAEENSLLAETDLHAGDIFSTEKLSVVALQLRKFGVVKESTAILDEEHGIVGIAFWLKPAGIN